MKLLDYSNKEFDGLVLGGNTMFVMAHTPKILLFETSTELYKFMRVWELIGDYIDEHEELDDEDCNLSYYASWFVDPFEQEWMFKEDLENGTNEHEPRNIIVENASHLDDECFGNEYDVKLGTLNSSDMYISPKDTEYHIKLLEILFATEELNKRLKDDTREVFNIFYELLKEELENSKKEDKKYFKVTIIGD